MNIATTVALGERTKKLDLMRRNELRRSARQWAAAVMLGAMSAIPAFAQISKVDSVMAAVQTTLTGVSVTAFTVALIWAGFKMAFQHAKWSEISNIVVGGILVGGAAGIASWLLSS
jgi:type IV secretion system protein VirB2